jgi:hypothetical protein
MEKSVRICTPVLGLGWLEVRSWVRGWRKLLVGRKSVRDDKHLFGDLEKVGS